MQFVQYEDVQLLTATPEQDDRLDRVPGLRATVEHRDQRDEQAGRAARGSQYTGNESVPLSQRRGPGWSDQVCAAAGVSSNAPSSDVTIITPSGVSARVCST